VIAISTPDPLDAGTIVAALASQLAHRADECFALRVGALAGIGLASGVPPLELCPDVADLDGTDGSGASTDDK
jgi:hypothetical protein